MTKDEALLDKSDASIIVVLIMRKEVFIHCVVCCVCCVLCAVVGCVLSTVGCERDVDCSQDTVEILITLKHTEWVDLRTRSAER